MAGNIIQLRVNGQRISRVDENVIIADTRNYFHLQFEFSEEWEEFTPRTAIFLKTEDNETRSYYVKLVNDECLIPWECLTQGSCIVSVVGGNRLTADSFKMEVSPSGFTTVRTDIQPTEDLYQAIIDELAKYYEALDKNITIDAEAAVRRIIDEKRGSAEGLASLDENGVVPSSQLPSYVDDVIEAHYDKEIDRFYINKEGTREEIVPEAGKVYVDIDSNVTYRWSGSQHVVIGSDLALGETSSTAYAGDKGKKLRDDVDELQEDSHTHDNKATLDKIGESEDGKLTYNGSKIDPEIPDATESQKGLMTSEQVSTLNDVEDASHTHDNKDLLDDITEENLIEIRDETVLQISSDKTIRIESLENDVLINANKNISISAVKEVSLVSDEVSIIANGTTKRVSINIGDDYGAVFSTDGLEVYGDIADSKGTLDTVRIALANKVDAISGKGLSTNDFTTEEKNKLTNIENQATYNPNAVSGVTINGVTKLGPGLLDFGNLGGNTDDTNLKYGTRDLKTCSWYQMDDDEAPGSDDGIGVYFPWGKSSEKYGHELFMNDTNNEFYHRNRSGSWARIFDEDYHGSFKKITYSGISSADLFDGSIFNKCNLLYFIASFGNPMTDNDFYYASYSDYKICPRGFIKNNMTINIGNYMTFRIDLIENLITITKNDSPYSLYVYGL